MSEQERDPIPGEEPFIVERPERDVDEPDDVPDWSREKGSDERMSPEVLERAKREAAKRDEREELEH